MPTYPIRPDDEDLGRRPMTPYPVNTGQGAAVGMPYAPMDRPPSRYRQNMIEKIAQKRSMSRLPPVAPSAAPAGQWDGPRFSPGIDTHDAYNAVYGTKVPNAPTPASVPGMLPSYASIRNEDGSPYLVATPFGTGSYATPQKITGPNGASDTIAPGMELGERNYGAVPVRQGQDPVVTRLRDQAGIEADLMAGELGYGGGHYGAAADSAAIQNQGAATAVQGATNAVNLQQKYGPQMMEAAVRKANAPPALTPEDLATVEETARQAGQTLYDNTPWLDRQSRGILFGTDTPKVSLGPLIDQERQRLMKQLTPQTPGSMPGGLNPSGVQAKEGATMTGSDGRKYIRRGGQWVPA